MRSGLSSTSASHGERRGRLSPRFTVVIPTFVRPERLARCLDSIARVESPRGGFEVVVVDDGGRVPLAPALDAVHGRAVVTLLEIAHRGQASARNWLARHFEALGQRSTVDVRRDYEDDTRIAWPEVCPMPAPVPPSGPASAAHRSGPAVSG